MKTCKHCEATIPEWAKRCPHCRGIHPSGGWIFQAFLVLVVLGTAAAVLLLD